MGIRGDGAAWSVTVVPLKKMKIGNPPPVVPWPPPFVPGTKILADYRFRVTWGYFL